MAKAEFRTKTERKKCKNTQNISLDESYPPFGEYLQGSICLYPETVRKKYAKALKKADIYEEAPYLLA